LDAAMMPENGRSTHAPSIDAALDVDVPVLVDLMSEFHAESNYRLDRAWAQASFRQLLGDPARGGAWIARTAGGVAGYVVLTLRHSMEFGGLCGIIDDLYVRPDSRRQGVGCALLRELFDACRAVDAKAVTVEVGSENAAGASLYRKFGLAGNDDGRRTLAVRLVQP
jgi:ribosomal protein S18 acetylase RimI-like enzyme